MTRVSISVQYASRPEPRQVSSWMILGRRIVRDSHRSPGFQSHAGQSTYMDPSDFARISSIPLPSIREPHLEQVCHVRVIRRLVP